MLERKSRINLGSPNNGAPGGGDEEWAMNMPDKFMKKYPKPAPPPKKEGEEGKEGAPAAFWEKYGVKSINQSII